MRRIAAGTLIAALGCDVLFAQGPLFRANTDIVPVYVSVRAGNDTIGALASSDFALTDRGVPQTVEVVSSDAVPIDVTLVVDTSFSVTNSLPLFRSEVQTIVGQLQPNEQVRLITFDTEVLQILTMQSFSCSPTGTTHRAFSGTRHCRISRAGPIPSCTSRWSSHQAPTCRRRRRWPPFLRPPRGRAGPCIRRRRMWAASWRRSSARSTTSGTATCSSSRRLVSPAPDGTTSP
jgi:hypothetical protein